MNSAGRGETPRFVAGFEELGYRRLPVAGSRISHALDRWYEGEWSNEVARHVAFLEFKPSWNAYAIRLGITSPPARSFLERALPAITKFLRPELIGPGLNVVSQPCWTLFDAGRALRWNLLCIPDPANPASWPAALEQFRSDWLNAIFRNVRTHQDILQLLLRNDPPFEWSIGYAVLRAAETIALGQIANADRTWVLSEVRKHQKSIAMTMHGTADFEEMLSHLAVNIWPIR